MITGKTHFAEFNNDDSATIEARDGILSGLIGQEGAVGVIYGTGFNIGGFIASPVVTICAKDVFNTDCPVNADVSVQKAFCLNTVANEGKNPFHAMCDEATHGTTGQLNEARRDVCLADVAGTLTDPSCAMDTLAEGVCGTNPFLHPGCENLDNDMQYRTVYCQNPATTWDADECDTEATYGTTKDTRDTACEMHGTVVATGGDISCANRANVRLLCNGNPFTKTTADTSEELCTGMTEDSGGETYLSRRNVCKRVATSFTLYCNDEDNSDGGSDTLVKRARDMDCEARGTVADTRCANRANVLTACDMDAYRQTTGLGVSNTNLCTGMSVDLADTYSNLRMACERPDAGMGSFADYCDSQDLIGAVQTARNSYCGAKLTDLSEASGQGNCVSRLDAICITNPTAPFAGICGTGITAGQIMACSGTISDLTTKGAMAGDCNDDDLSGAICGDTNSMGGSNPFAEICSNMDAIRTGFMKDKAQLEACKGALNTLPANNSCASRGLSGMICGNDASESGSNPFAPICESPTQNENYLNRVASRQISCGNDRLGALDANKVNCDTLQDGLCDTAVKSLSATMRGEGNFVCSTDDGPTVVLLRNNYCEDPATTYNDVVGCRNAEGNNDGEVRKVRKQLGVDCVKGNTKNDASLHADCQKTVNGAITVEDCSANPYRERV